MTRTGLLSVIRWILGVFFLVVFVAFLSESLVTSLLSLVLVVLVLPPVSKRIFSKIKYPVSRRKKLALVVGTMFLMLISTPTDTDRQDKGTDTQTSASTQDQDIRAENATSESESTPISNATVSSEASLASQTISDDPNISQATVISVIDGDTIQVDLGEGNIQKVRYIGIDTPESVALGQPVECYAQEASQRNKQLVGGKVVRLEKDVSETDKYGRLLRYVYVDEQFVNQVLVAEGFANASSYPPDIKYQKQLGSAEKEARESGKGLWSVCAAPNPKPVTQPAPVKSTTPVQSTAPVPVSNPTGRSCNGPDLDCKDFSTQVEAQAFFNSCGWDAHNDPMRLDSVGVGDGIPCESLP